jgi:hypothetical protein
MDKLRSFSVLAALSLAAAAYAQTDTPAQNAPSTTVTHPTPNPELAGASTASRTHNTRMAAASSQPISDGMQVRSESGDLLGSVSTIIPGDQRNDAYVVMGDIQGLATMMPYEMAAGMAQKDKLVVDRTAFEKAPKLQKAQIEDRSLEGFKRRSDDYWKKHAMSEDSTGPTRR